MPHPAHTLAFAAAFLGAPIAAHAASCSDTLVFTPELTRFAGIVQQSGLAPQLSSGTLTVFAPTNAALNGISSVTQMLGGQSANSAPDFPKLQTLVRAHRQSDSCRRSCSLRIHLAVEHEAGQAATEATFREASWPPTT